MTLLQNQGAQAFPELTLCLSPTKYLIPDIAVADDFPGSYPTKQSASVAKSFHRTTGWGRNRGDAASSREDYDRLSPGCSRGIAARPLKK